MYGQDAFLALSYNTSYGLTAVNSPHFVEFISETLTLTKEQYIKQGLRGIVDENDSIESKNSVSGEIAAEADAYNLPVFFRSMMDVAITSSSGLTRYAFTPFQNDFDADHALRPLNIYVFQGFSTSSIGDLFLDCAINNIELSYVGGDFLKVKAGVMGVAAVSSGVAVTPSYPSSNLVAWDITSVSVNGAGSCRLDDLTITIDVPIEPKFPLCVKGSLTTRTASRMKRSQARTITVAGTLAYTDRTAADLFKNQTKFPFVVSAIDASSVGIIVDIPSLKFTEFPMTIEGPGELVVAFTAKAQYHVGSGTALKVTVVSSLTGI